MKLTVFDFNHYVPYLKSWIASRPSNGRGEQRRFAQAMRCHSAYVTLMLKGTAHLSLEQAALLNEYLGHKEDESGFFLLLVQHSRAGNRPLKEYFSKQIRQISNERVTLKNRLEYRKTVGEQEQGIYYSAWYYGAIHVLLTIPEFRTREGIARRLNLPSAKVAEVLEFLVSVGLANESKGKYTTGVASVHLGDNVPMVNRHHINWRLRAMEALDHPRLDELHYSSVATVAHADLPKIRAILVKAIEESRNLVRDSPGEEIFGYSVDLFRL